MLAGAHKKFYRVQHAEVYLLDLKVQYKHKMKLSLAMVSKHIFLYLCLPYYNKGQSIYDEMSHNVVYLFSIYDEIMSHIYFQPQISATTKWI